MEITAGFINKYRIAGVTVLLPFYASNVLDAEVILEGVGDMPQVLCYVTLTYENKYLIRSEVNKEHSISYKFKRVVQEKVRKLMPRIIYSLGRNMN